MLAAGGVADVIRQLGAPGNILEGRRSTKCDHVISTPLHSGEAGSLQVDDDDRLCAARSTEPRPAADENAIAVFERNQGFLEAGRPFVGTHLQHG